MRLFVQQLPGLADFYIDGKTIPFFVHVRFREYRFIVSHHGNENSGSRFCHSGSIDFGADCYA